MKQEVAKDKASRLINCGMVVLITSAYNTKQNVTACAWHSAVSKSPPLVSVALSKKHCTSALIKHSGEFTVNILPWPLLDKVIACGTKSGYDINKFVEAGLTVANPSVLTLAPKVGEGVAGKVIRTGRPILVHDIEKSRKFRKKSEKRYFSSLKSRHFEHPCTVTFLSGFCLLAAFGNFFIGR